MYDIAIIGRGPAGISAAITAHSRNKSTIIFGRESKKVLSSPIIDNYPGLPGIKGTELIERFENHLKIVNPTLSTKSITAVYSMGTHFSIQCENEMIDSKTVIIAVGVDFKKSIENEDKFLGMGISYCATCDAPLYKEKTVAVIGYNSESIEEAKFLSEICNKVYFIPVIKNFDLKIPSNMEIVKDIPVRFEGSMKTDRLVLKNSEIVADGYFVIKDSYPLTTLIPGLEVNGAHVVVNSNMETNIKGVYAAGDAAGKPYQIAKAIGEGQVAVLSAIEYIAKMD